MKIAGVYKITNIITGEFYIGSSKDIKRRWADHKCLSMWKQQPNSKLYKDMASYGKDKFIFEVIEETTDLRNREQYYIEQLKPSYNSLYAKGHDTERYKETNRQCTRAWYKVHRDEKLVKSKAYYDTHRDEYLAKKNIYQNKLCLYGGETLTLNTLSARFFRQGISHARLEAKKYLIQE